MKNKGTGIELWNRAKTIIPGGSQLLSQALRNVPARAVAFIL